MFRSFTARQISVPFVQWLCLQEYYWKSPGMSLRHHHVRLWLSSMTQVSCDWFETPFLQRYRFMWAPQPGNVPGHSDVPVVEVPAQLFPEGFPRCVLQFFALCQSVFVQPAWDVPHSGVVGGNRWERKPLNVEKNISALFIIVIIKFQVEVFVVVSLTFCFNLRTYYCYSQAINCWRDCDLWKLTACFVLWKRFALILRRLRK